ncbi:hypothetical protein PYTT13_14055 [Paracoccus yeei]|uniref:IstB-like ATP-binding domain-containing protein n=1 Tax=Paracoccus yeei TaxID=147645 RepID=A0A2D2C2S0_9RHOB|nr:hypothetical protein PYTT13_14055 [Paracoccus yeei]
MCLSFCVDASCRAGAGKEFAHDTGLAILQDQPHVLLTPPISALAQRPYVTPLHRKVCSSAIRSPESFDFAAIPKLDKVQVLGLDRCEWIERRETIIAFGPADTGKTPVALVDRLAHHVNVLKRNGES